MKYPQQQFKLLKDSIEVLATHFEVKEINPSHLHYIVYQQASEGQLHNALYIDNAGQIKKGYQIQLSDKANYKKLIDFLNESNFDFYPEGCNDNHIETAVKAIVKTLS